MCGLFFGLNMTPLRTVRLYGKLGARFGRVFQLAVNSPAEAVRALGAQLRGFNEYLMNAKDHGVGFAVFAGAENLSREQLAYPVGEDDIRIAPILMGSKSGGIFQIILGAILIVAGLYLHMPFLVQLGATMILGGIVQLLSPHPNTLGAKDSAKNTPNYSFNGPVNTEAQGHPVPVLYGEAIVGSAVISASIQLNEDVYVPTGTAATGTPSPSTGDGGGGIGTAVRSGMVRSYLHP